MKCQFSVWYEWKLDFESENRQIFEFRKKTRENDAVKQNESRALFSSLEFKSLLSSSLHGCSTRIFPVRGSAQANQRSHGVMRAKQNSERNKS
jgi:hypothetical protein